LIIAWLGFFIMIGAAAFFWWFESDVLTLFLNRVIGMNAAYIPVDDKIFMQAVIHWMPLFFLLGGLMFLIIFTEREPAQGYY